MKTNGECEKCPYLINNSFNTKDAKLWRIKTRQLGHSLIHECLRDYYEDRFWSISDLARHYDVSPTAIRQRLHIYGVKMRPPGGASHRAKLGVK